MGNFGEKAKECYHANPVQTDSNRRNAWDKEMGAAKENLFAHGGQAWFKCLRPGEKNRQHRLWKNQ